MRHLLIETQDQLRKMVDENQQLAMRMDGDLQAAQQQVRELRHDLQETKSKITQMQSFSSSPHLSSSSSSSQRLPISQSKIPSSVTRNSSPKNSSKIPVNVSKSFPSDGAGLKPRSLSAEGRRRGRAQENGDVGDSDQSSGTGSVEPSSRCRDGGSSTEKAKGASVRKISSASTASDGSKSGIPDAGGDAHTKPPEGGEAGDSPVKGDSCTNDGTAPARAPAAPASAPDAHQMTHLVTELCHAKEALAALKADRKRLKTEKVDLLMQMKQLYATLEDKEAELRDFIRNFEQRMVESEESERRLRAEREAGERERWGLLNRLGEESDRAARLVATLTARERELQRVRQQLASLGYHSDGDASFRSNNSCLASTTSPPVPSPPPNSSALTPSTSAPLPLSSSSPHPITSSASAPTTINSTPNGRGSSADSGVRLSSDRDSTASHEGPSTCTPPKDPSCIYATPHMHNNKTNNTHGVAANPYHTTSLYSTSPPHNLSYSTYSSSPPPLPCLPRNGHLAEGGVPAYSSSALYGTGRPGGSDTPRSLGGLGSEGSSEGCDYSGPRMGSLYSSCNTPSSDRSVRVGLSQSTEQLCNTVAEAAEQALQQARSERLYGNPAPSGEAQQTAAPKAGKTKGASMTLSRRTQRALGGGGGGGGGTWGSISRVFARQKKRNPLDTTLYDGPQNGAQQNNGPSNNGLNWPPGAAGGGSIAPLSEETYPHKLRLLEEAQHIPLERWKAPTVLAWLEITLGMPQYGALCAENVRSGKVLLELSDHELESGLGIVHPMHRKKLRLAIEELREPRLCRYPVIATLSHTWVANEWLTDLGLPHYAEAFAAQLVDGRVLDTLTKKELEKQLGVHRKFHQASIIHGIHLLRIVRFDRRVLQERRRAVELRDDDPVVWTNHRWVRWARAIDLGEYAENLTDSGVHGGLVVLESTFTADTMATALGIPSSKTIIRRHLATELETLVLPQRRQLEEAARCAKLERRRQEKQGSGGSLGRTFSRNGAACPDKRRSSLRGSLSRALGLRLRDEMSSADLPSPSSSTAPPPPLPQGPFNPYSRRPDVRGLRQSPSLSSCDKGVPIRPSPSSSSSIATLRSNNGPPQRDYNSSDYGPSPQDYSQLPRDPSQIQGRDYPSQSQRDYGQSYYGAYGGHPPQREYGGPTQYGPPSHSTFGNNRPRSSVVAQGLKNVDTHRRVRSIGDMEHVTVTPV
ncbi:liprin-alpha-3 isoform X2 [Hyalella azteca]|nr:liprin-alpha-3 isoform X2 [Hyalella azteca]